MVLPPQLSNVCFTTINFVVAKLIHFLPLSPASLPLLSTAFPYSIVVLFLFQPPPPLNSCPILTSALESSDHREDYSTRSAVFTIGHSRFPKSLQQREPSQLKNPEPWSDSRAYGGRIRGALEHFSAKQRVHIIAIVYQLAILGRVLRPVHI